MRRGRSARQLLVINVQLSGRVGGQKQSPAAGNPSETRHSRLVYEAFLVEQLAQFFLDRIDQLYLTRAEAYQQADAFGRCGDGVEIVTGGIGALVDLLVERFAQVCGLLHSSVHVDVEFAAVVEADSFSVVGD